MNMKFLECPDCGANFFFDLSDIDEYFISADGTNLIRSSDLNKQGGREESEIRCGCSGRSHRWRFDDDGRLILSPAASRFLRRSPEKKSCFKSNQSIDLMKCPNCGEALIYEYTRVYTYSIAEGPSRQPGCEQDAYLVKEGLWGSFGIRENILCKACANTPRWSRDEKSRIFLLTNP